MLSSLLVPCNRLFPNLLCFTPIWHLKFVLRRKWRKNRRGRETGRGTSSTPIILITWVFYIRTCYWADRMWLCFSNWNWYFPLSRISSLLKAPKPFTLGKRVRKGWYSSLMEHSLQNKLLFLQLLTFIFLMTDFPVYSRRWTDTRKCSAIR